MKQIEIGDLIEIKDTYGWVYEGIVFHIPDVDNYCVYWQRDIKPGHSTYKKYEIHPNTREQDSFRKLFPDKKVPSLILMPYRYERGGTIYCKLKKCKKSLERDGFYA